MNQRNVVLAGVPRSGSTLVCHLFNKLANAVALHEPMKVGQFKRLPDRESVLDDIAQFFECTRDSLEQSGTAFSKNISGRVPANPVGLKRTWRGFRKSAVTRSKVVFEKPFSAESVLVVKHNAAFAALIPSLVNRFSTYAVVRNPVAVLSSWNSVEMPVRSGHAPAAESLDRDLRRRLASIADRRERQVHLLLWFFDQFAMLPAERVIRYEDVIESGGSCLGSVVRSAESLDEPLQNQNRNRLYDPMLPSALSERLLREDNASIWQYYSRSSVEEFLN